MLSITDKINFTNHVEPEILPVERWINFELSVTDFEYNRYLDNYRFDLAANIIYEFIWEKYCDWYIEISKVFLYQEETSKKTKQLIAANLVTTLQNALIILHPIMPFITEELWSTLEKTRGSTKKFSDIELTKSSKPLERSTEIRKHTKTDRIYNGSKKIKNQFKSQTRSKN